MSRDYEQGSTPEQRFMTMPQEAIDQAVELSHTALPETWDDTRQYCWVEAARARTDLLALQRVVSVEFTVILNGVRARQTHDTGEVRVSKYFLRLPDGAFMASHEAHESLDTIHENTGSDVALYELGMMKPDQGDWEEFMELLQGSKTHVENRRRRLGMGAAHPIAIDGAIRQVNLRPRSN